MPIQNDPNNQHPSVDNPIDETNTEVGDQSMEDTFKIMVEKQREMQIFSMNVNIATAQHQAKQNAIQNINR